MYAKYADEDLLNSYFDELDQDIKMGVIKAMSELKNAAYVPAFVDAIGAEIGNHCQGNIRRVAACALGDINWSHQFESRAFSIAMEKLGWTLQYPDDWGLRYSACIALEGIGNSKAQSLLVESKTKEVDQAKQATVCWSGDPTTGFVKLCIVSFRFRFVSFLFPFCFVSFRFRSFRFVSFSFS